MLERSELSSSSWHRRYTLLALTALAKQAKGSHTPLTRWRLKQFHTALEAMEGNDEVEVAGDTFYETVSLAMAALGPR